MNEAGEPGPYSVPLEDLVREVRVPFDEQTTVQQADPVPSDAPDEERRQLRLAGGG